MPVDSLERLIFEENIYVDAMEEMMSEVQAYKTLGGVGSRETAILSIVIPWEASEKVIIHFLNQLAPYRRLDFLIIWQLGWLTKYSIAF